MKSMKKIYRIVVLIMVLCMGISVSSTSVDAASKPKKVTITSAKSPSSGKITVKWKKVSQASGYQIQVSKSKTFKKVYLYDNKKVSASKRSKSYSGLTKEMKYYVRVRAYKKAGNTVKYGAWSKVKAITIKGTNTNRVKLESVRKKYYTATYNAWVKNGDALLKKMAKKYVETNYEDVVVGSDTYNLFYNSAYKYYLKEYEKLFDCTPGTAYNKLSEYSKFMIAMPNIGLTNFIDAESVVPTYMSYAANGTLNCFYGEYGSYSLQSKVFTALNKKTASGVCDDFRVVIQFIASGLGVPSETVDNDFDNTYITTSEKKPRFWSVRDISLDHAWNIAKLKKSNGSYVYVLIDNGSPTVITSASYFKTYYKNRVKATKKAMGKNYPF